MKKDCCWKCEERMVGCHGTCPRYDEKKRQFAWAQREKNTITSEAFYSFKTDMVERTKKWITR